MHRSIPDVGMYLEGIAELSTVLGTFIFYPALAFSMVGLAQNSEKKYCSAFMWVSRVQLFTVPLEVGRRVFGIVYSSEHNVLLMTQSTDTGLTVEALH